MFKMRFITNIFLFTLISIENTKVLCHREEKFKKVLKEEDYDLQKINENISIFSFNKAQKINYHFKNTEQKRPIISNIDKTIKDMFNNDCFRNVSHNAYIDRYKRKVPDQRLSDIRKKLFNEKKKEEMMSADANPRMEPNDTATAKHKYTDLEHSGVNREQMYNKQNDKIRLLHQQNWNKKQNEFESGIDCDFETDCLWTWRKDIANGFFITSGKKFGTNETGPRQDANNKEFAKYMTNVTPSNSTIYNVAQNGDKGNCTCCPSHHYVDYLKQILNQQTSIKSLMTDILAEITSKNSRATEIADPNESVLNKFNLPIKEDHDLELLNRYLENENFAKAATEFCKIRGKDNYDFVKRSMGILLTNEYAQQYSWLGRRQKKSFCNNMVSKLVIGSFLLLRLPLKSTEFHVVSPLFSPTTSSCKLAIWIYQEQMDGGKIKIVGDKTSEHYRSLNNHTQWLVKSIDGDNSKKWKKYDMSVGKISENFTIILEVVPSENMVNGATVAFDNIHLFHCYQKNDDTCTPHQYRCKATKTCINSTSICDITKDCLHGDDEIQNCNLMPYGSRCNFEEDWCGWQNIDIKYLEWVRHNGSTPTNFTGPNYDHTYMNTTGNYLYVNMLKENADFAATAVLRSVDFNPPPRVHGNSSSKFYNSCAIRFYLHKTGKHKSGILLQVTELRPSENVSREILWSYDDHGDQWVRQVLILPNITYRYFIHFEARKGLRYISDIAIDDVSLSPECFGLNIPPEELNGYNYWNPTEGVEAKKETHKDFVNKTFYEITTCHAEGRFGPTQRDCSRAYNGTKVNIKVVHEPGLTGVQKWVVPHDGYYTFILTGASGGKGSSVMGSSRGAMIRTVAELKKGQEIFMLVGQEGTNSCVKSLGYQENSSCYSEKTTEMGIRRFLFMDINDSGGGGGGATYVFLRNRTKEKIPLAVAGGGGGLGIGHFSVDNIKQHGQGINMSRAPVTGRMYGVNSAGAGGGWTMFSGLLEPAHKQMMGNSLQGGGIGGKACYNSTDRRGDGGFGGGGGGCKYGGGGGGYSGGDAPSINSTNGEGGYSFLDVSKTIQNLSEVQYGYNAGPGYILIIPAIDGCDCDYRCIALDAKRSETTCICPKTWKLSDDEKTCTVYDFETPETYPAWFVVGLIVTVFCLTVAFGVVCFVLYSGDIDKEKDNRYQQRSTGIKRRKIPPGAEFPLDRIRVTSDHMMTEYNPNYEFGGVVYTLKDLKDIPREQLRLVKALGQGAFGEVYQGFYRQRPCDTVEMPVAVKTLPEMSTTQAEMDFLMEALIMSKFNHPNIVHFIGVCFDKHPRFIVLELLAGGDLKNFLRESRPKPERVSPLSMKDLVLISVDVAKGCKYLEDNRFIHRDIAARNCLLTTKGPGRCVKIADFGMSRDVYRSDYYRKGGKAMLPIKWMPPEAFLDGIFTSKTDVWSFGVLLWEIMSMGYMPYTGCANREVMQLVTSGGRLDPPANCPGPIYGIMTQCWHPAPEQRPTFSTILERLGYCSQDPQVMNAPLPVFQRPLLNEKDSTLMRPLSSEENCLQVVPTSSDYLIPNHSTPITPDQIESTSSIEKLLPDNSDNWETSFIMPHSRSTQPLLMENNREDECVTSVDKLLSIDNPTPNPKISPICLLNNNPNHNNLKSESNLKSGISLDVGALAKQAMMSQNKKYANVNTGEAVTSNGVLQKDPFSNHIGHNQKYLNEAEINC